ncbi:enhanced intracellular survival protein Eis [soil metagenome]
MAIEIRTPTDDDLPAMVRLDGLVFGTMWKPDDFEKVRPTIELDRFRIAVDHDQIVGVAGSFGFEMTLPGGGSVPTGGVTWVAVVVTHRRQGVLRRMLDAVHDDIDARDEPLAALTASEGAIYERFGYGIAAFDRHVEIDRRRAQLRDGVHPTPGSVRLGEGDELVGILADRWERGRVGRPGEISRSEAWHRKNIAQRGEATVYAVHDHGYASWKVTDNWNQGLPQHELRLHELIAATPAAHLDLWATVLSVDLVGPIRTGNLPFDDPLQYLLVDHRLVRTLGLNDGVWLDVRDVPRCFDARTYGTEDDVVIEADGVRWRIGAGGCRKVRTRPDLIGPGASLSALLLGGVRPSTLAAGRRLEVRNSEALRRADALFVTSPVPYNQTGF